MSTTQLAAVTFCPRRARCGLAGHLKEVPHGKREAHPRPHRTAATLRRLPPASPHQPRRTPRRPTRQSGTRPARAGIASATATPSPPTRLPGHLRRRLHLLGLTTQERLGEPTRLTPTGHAAAHTALRARALRPREHPPADADPARNRPAPVSRAPPGRGVERRRAVWTADDLTFHDAVVPNHTLAW
jgi:hypothetical protein